MFINREKAKSGTRKYVPGLTDARNVYVIVWTVWIQKQGRGNGLNHHNTKSKANISNWLKINKMMGRVHWMCMFSHIQLFATLWTTAPQAPLSMGFSGQEYWSGLPFPCPGDLPDPEIEPPSLASPVWASGLFTTGKPKDTLLIFTTFLSWFITCNTEKSAQKKLYSSMI